MKLVVNRDSINYDIFYVTILSNIKGSYIEDDKTITIDTDDKNVSNMIEEHISTYPKFTKAIFNIYKNNIEIATTKKIQETVDNMARSKGYEDMKSARSYTGFDNPFRKECLKLSIWCANCWAEAAKIKQEYDRGIIIEPPTLTYILDRLPKYEE